MALRATLNVHVPWTNLAKLLDLPCKTLTLPARTDCPFCGKHRMYIYHDSTLGGQWHYCYDCRRSGDMIELAAATWEISPRVAVRKLAAAGFSIPSDQLTEEGLSTYVREHLQYRRRVADFWRQAQDYLIKNRSEGLALLRSRFRLGSQMPQDRWEAGPARLMGAFYCPDAERLLRPGSDYGGFVGGRGKIFHGGPWTEALVFPYQSMPERIASFHFVGYRRKQEDRRFKCMYEYRRDNPLEPGLFGLDMIEAARGTFGRHVFAVDDPLLAMRLHIRHFGTSLTPLPLVAWYDKHRLRTHAAWYAAQDKQVIFWGWKLTAQMVWQAIKCDGYIYITNLEQENHANIQHYLRLLQPTDLCRRLIRHARPWKNVLVDWIESLENRTGPLDELMLGLKDRGVDITQLSADLGRHVEVSFNEDHRKMVQYGDHFIHENAGGWFRTRTTHKNDSVLLSQAILRIDRHIVGDKPRYEGRILFNGVSIQFSEEAKIVENKTAKFIIDRCITQTKRPIIAPAAHDLVSIAISFHQPDLIQLC